MKKGHKQAGYFITIQTKAMKKIIFIIMLMIFVNHKIAAQGCVAIRSTGNSCSMNHPGDERGWKLNLNNRYFRSYKHFVGKEEQKNRVDSSTQVINHSYSLDITLTRTFNTRWSAALTVPVIYNTRSSKYEHYGNTSKSANARQATHSFGIGDTRLMLYRWMLDPVKNKKGNMQIGLGLKLPTGDFRYQDYFQKNDTTSTLGPVDQSIQLGDGGTGIATEIKAYYKPSKKLSVYADAYYLVNPREQNGVSTSRGGITSANSMKYFTAYMSVPDQFMARAGLTYSVKKFEFTSGIRIEGIPAEDLVGGNKGFRRPGYVIAVEPVISYRTKKLDFYLSVPVAVQRNRVQSYADKLQTTATGIRTQGDAAFADYSLNAGFTINF